jgi:hypothetical protein
MVSNEILQSTFLIKHGDSTGTCFLISVKGSDFLITARHLFSKTTLPNAPVNIEILRNDGWIKFNPVLLIHDNPKIDIAVLDLKSNSQKDNLFDIRSLEYYLSQDCYFIGFPFGLKMDDKEGSINNGFPIPFVKKGIISSFISDSDKMTQIFLDGHNNPGFSGGPVVVTKLGAKNDHRMKVIGVVSAYLNEDKVFKTPIGDFSSQENTGIVLSFASNHIFEIIDRK